jgi:hypothetical protein
MALNSNPRDDPCSTLAEMVAAPTRHHRPRRSPRALFFVLDNGFALCERGSGINTGGFSAEALEEKFGAESEQQLYGGKRVCCETICPGFLN